MGRRSACATWWIARQWSRTCSQSRDWPPSPSPLRDALIGRIPVVLRSELYAISALAGALIVVITDRLGVFGVPAAIGAATLCFTIRMLAVCFSLNAPAPPGTGAD